MAYQLSHKPKNPVLNRNHPLANNLVLDIPFSEGIGSTVHDISGHGYIGAVNGGSWETKEYGRQLAFTGLDSDRVRLDLKSQHLDLGRVTIQTIVNNTAVPNQYSRLWQIGGDYPNFRLSFEIEDGGGNRWNIIGATDGFYYHYAIPKPSTGLHNVILAADFTAFNVAPRLVIDGEVITPSQIQTQNQPFRTGIDDLTIGNAITENNSWPGGFVAFRMWQRRLSYGEMMRLTHDPWGQYKQRKATYNVSAAINTRRYGMPLLGVS